MSEKKSTGAGAKDVIYIDVDDEITGIIDKVRGSGHKIVALVLPKRAGVLQSIVNMKLLKRTADEAKKSIVLITSEAGLLPLAGSVGFYAAKNLQSKPEIPDAPTQADKAEAVEEAEDDGPDEDASLDKTKSIGELAGVGAAGAELEDTIELGDEDSSSEAGDKPKDGAKATKGKDKKLKIPNFTKFRLLIMLGVLGLGLFIAVAIVCFKVLPKATVTIKTDSTAINSSMNMTLKTGDNVVVDTKTAVVPAHKQEVKKTVNQQVSASGQQNNGVKSTGTIKFYNCNKEDTLTDTARTILAGTGVNANGLTFIVGENVVVQPSHFKADGTCKQDVPSQTVPMTAQVGGAKYNQAAATYVVAGYSTIAGFGTETMGGTDDITKVVSQADIDSATQKIGAQDTAGVKDQLKTDLTNGQFMPIESTFNTGATDTKSSAKAGDKAENVTVTQTITYTMLGAKEADIEKLVAEDIGKKVDLKKQSITSYGLDKATFTLQEQKPDGALVLMQTTAVVGPELDANSLKKEVAGKKAGDAENLIKSHPGVTDVSVEYHPFWVSSIPKNTSKITITIEKPQAPDDVDDASAP
jgi:hypothetical protein